MLNNDIWYHIYINISNIQATSLLNAEFSNFQNTECQQRDNLFSLQWKIPISVFLLIIFPFKLINGDRKVFYKKETLYCYNLSVHFTFVALKYQLIFKWKMSLHNYNNDIFCRVYSNKRLFISGNPFILSRYVCFIINKVYKR